MDTESPFFLVFTNRDLLRYITCFHARAIHQFFKFGRANYIQYFKKRYKKYVKEDINYMLSANDAAFEDYLIKNKTNELYRFLKAREVTEELCKKNKIKIIMAFNQLKFGELAMNYAAAFGALETLKYLVKKGYKYSDKAMLWAIEFKKLDVVKWLYERSGHFNIFKVNDKAIWANDIDLFNFIADNTEYHWTASHFELAVSLGNLDIIKSLHARAPEVVWPENIITKAAEWGYLEVVKWLFETIGAQPSPGAITFAAMKNHFEVVIYLCKVAGHTITHNTMEAAARYSKLTIVKYLGLVRPELITERTIILAIYSKKIDKIKYLCENLQFSGPKILSEDVLLAAVDNDKIGAEITRYIYEFGAKGVEKAIKAAVSGQKIDVINYFVDKGLCKITTQWVPNRVGSGFEQIVIT